MPLVRVSREKKTDLEFLEKCSRNTSPRGTSPLALPTFSRDSVDRTSESWPRALAPRPRHAKRVVTREKAEVMRLAKEALGACW